MAHLTRPAEISGVSAGLFPETAAGNRAYDWGGMFRKVNSLCERFFSPLRDSLFCRSFHGEKITSGIQGSYLSKWFSKPIKKVWLKSRVKVGEDKTRSPIPWSTPAIDYPNGVP